MALAGLDRRRVRGSGSISMAFTARADRVSGVFASTTEGRHRHWSVYGSRAKKMAAPWPLVPRGRVAAGLHVD